MGMITQSLCDTCRFKYSFACPKLKEKATNLRGYRGQSTMVIVRIMNKIAESTFKCEYYERRSYED